METARQPASLMLLMLLTILTCGVLIAWQANPSSSSATVVFNAGASSKKPIEQPDAPRPPADQGTVLHEIDLGQLGSFGQVPTAGDRVDIMVTNELDESEPVIEFARVAESSDEKIVVELTPDELSRIIEFDQIRLVVVPDAE